MRERELAGVRERETLPALEQDGADPELGDASDVTDLDVLRARRVVEGWADAEGEIGAHEPLVWIVARALVAERIRTAGREAEEWGRVVAQVSGEREDARAEHRAAVALLADVDKLAAGVARYLARLP